MSSLLYSYYFGQITFHHIYAIYLVCSLKLKEGPCIVICRRIKFLYQYSTYPASALLSNDSFRSALFHSASKASLLH